VEERKYCGRQLSPNHSLQGAEYVHISRLEHFPRRKLRLRINYASTSLEYGMKTAERHHGPFLRAFLDRDTHARLKHKIIMLVSHPRVILSQQYQGFCVAHRIANKGQSAETTVGACSNTIPGGERVGITSATALIVTPAVVLLYEAPGQDQSSRRPSA
jgi:hypothetical protein